MIRRSLVIAALALLATVSGAQAGSTGSGVVRGVTAAGPHTVSVVVRAPGDLGTTGVSAQLGDQWATVQSVRRLGDTRPLHLVFAMDSSGSMAGAPMTAAVAAGQRLLDAVGRDDEVGLVTFSATPVIVSRLTHAVPGVRTAFSQLEPSNGTALYDGILAAVRVAGHSDAARRVIVLLSDGADTASHATLARVSRLLGQSGIELDAVGLADSGSFTAAPLEQMATATGGTYVSTGSPSGLAPLFERISRDRLSNSYAVTLALPQTSARDLHVRVQGGSAATVQLPAGVSGTSPSWWSEWGIVLVAMLGFAAVLGCSLVAFQLRGKRQPSLGARLSPYWRSWSGTSESTARRPSTICPTWSRSGWPAHRVAEAGHAVRESGTSIPTGVWLFVIGACASAGALVAGGVLGPLVAVIGLVAGLAVPIAVLRFKAGRRSRAFEAQLPDLLNVWASALRAGRSFSQALDTLVEEAGEPTRGEFRRAQRQVRLGVPIEQALDDLSKRVRSESFELVVLTTDVQRRVGGNVAVIFDQVADTVRKRQQFSARVRALTSMGRMSANVLLGMPFVIAGLLCLINYTYMSPLFDTHTGHILIAIALTMMSLGAVVLRRMVKPRAIA